MAVLNYEGLSYFHSLMKEHFASRDSFVAFTNSALTTSNTSIITGNTDLGQIATLKIGENSNILTAPGFTKITSLIPDNSDINSYTNCGLHRVQNSASSQTLTNAPFTNSGFSLITLVGYTASNDYRPQIAFGNEHIAYRNLKAENNNPSEWHRIPYVSATDPTTGSISLPVYVNNTGKISTITSLNLPSGDIAIGNTSSSIWHCFSAKRFISELGHSRQGQFGIDLNGQLSLRLLDESDPSTAINNLFLYHDRTVFTKPVTVSSGGTGASSAPGALINLGVISDTSQFVYNSGNIIASSTEPANPTEGMIWLKI